MQFRWLVPVSIALAIGCSRNPRAHSAQTPNRQVAPYGSWQSPLSAQLVTGHFTPVSEPSLSGGRAYWLESRPSEGGRVTLMRWEAGAGKRELVPPPFNVRSRVNAYGGGAYFVHGESVFFSNFSDQRIYRIAPGEPPRAITPAGDFRYADCAVDGPRVRAVCVREDRTAPAREPVDTLVSVDLEGRGTPRVLSAGHDFFSSPRVLRAPASDARTHAAPDQLAWLSWDHPNMPWDGTDLWRAAILDDGSLSPPEHVAGGARESIFQPEWSPSGVLHFVSDRSGFWNLYRWVPAKGGAPAHAEALAPMRADFGRAQFVFRLGTYGLSGDRIIAAYQEEGAGHLASIDPTRSMEQIAVPYATFSWLNVSGDRAVFVAASPREPASVVHLNLSTGEFQILARSASLQIDDRYLSLPEPLSFSGWGGQIAHAYLYRPMNDDFSAPRGERPPLLVRSHGGPTSRSEPVFSPETQYWTSRGFAVLDVNYGGSTGYGRAYRERLYGRWGLVDVDDCIAAARFVAEHGDADGERLLIGGGSAGGYTALAALAFRDVFRAGASLYGVSDLELFEQQTGATDKLEAHYAQRLVGPYPARRDIFVARSPLHSADKISAPVIFFQGVEDDVVPVNQARLMHAAVKKKGLLTALIEFPGEGHGFRKAENIQRVLTAELYFYSKVLGIALPPPVEPIPIDNGRP